MQLSFFTPPNPPLSTSLPENPEESLLEEVFVWDFFPGNTFFFLVMLTPLESLGIGVWTSCNLSIAVWQE